MRTPKLTPTITWLTSLVLVATVISSPMGVFAQSTGRLLNRASTERVRAEHPSLSSYAVDLTRIAKRTSTFETQHQNELSRVIRILAESSEHSPVLIGQAGEGNSADVAEIAFALARQIASGNVPATLQNKQVFSLNLNKLAAGAKDSGQFVARLQAVLADAASANGQIILFVDQLHQFVGNYANQQATAAVLSALTSHKVQIIGAATSDSYASYIAQDTSVNKFFQTVKINDGDSKNADVARLEKRTRAERGFVGEVISTDLRELMQSAKSENDQLDVIIQTPNVEDGRLNAFLKSHGVLVSDQMTALGTMKVQIPVKAVQKLAQSGMADFMSPNVEMHTLGHITATTGTDAIRNSGGCLLGLVCFSKIDGEGVGVAVLDSGVDKDHRAFKYGIKFKKDFTVENKPDTDLFGHGTHVASTVGGTSTRNGSSYDGIAPAASIINLRVLNSQGIGSSAVLLNALNWFLTPADPTRAVSSSNPLNKDKYGIRVVNMSLGAPAINSYKNDPLCRAARALVDAGLVVVAAAGNNGKDSNGNKVYGQIHSPGNEPSVITVGATNTFGTDGRNDDVVATYSSRGPTRSYVTDADGVKDYDNLVKPDLVAPGNKLIFAESDAGNADNLLVTLHPELDSGMTDDDNKKMMYLSGTSMATPMVAGAAALLLQVNPKLTPNMVKALLMYTAQPVKGYNMLEQGAGQLNVEGAVRIAKLVRTDLSNSTPVGAAFLTTNNAPTPQTTIGNQTFTWSRGLVMKYSYVTGVNLIMKYQRIYGQGLVMGDGDVAGDGIMVSDGIILGDGIVMGDVIMISDGIVMGDGLPFLAVSQLMGDGIMVSDSIILGDGIVMGDGIMVNDGIVMGDANVQAMSSRALINGDSSPSMH